MRYLVRSRGLGDVYKRQTMTRTAEVTRDTKETRIRVRVDLDGTGRVSARTGIGFFDTMLDALGRHALLDLAVECTGDLHVCPLYTSDAVDARSSADLGGRRMIKQQQHIDHD